VTEPEGPPRGALRVSRGPLLLDDADDVTLGVGEQSYRDAYLRNLIRTHHPRPAEALRLRQRGFDVGDLDVEGDVAVVALGRAPDAAPDPNPVGVRIPVTRDDRVVGRPDRVAELPAEQLRVVAAQLLPLPTDDLEVDNWLSLRPGSAAGVIDRVE
jgi:hypothetical protein